MRTRIRSLRTPFLYLLFNFLGSALAPGFVGRLVLEEGEEFTDAQNFGVGALVFLALTLVEVLVRVQRLEEGQELERVAIRFRSEVDADLVAVREAIDTAAATAGTRSLLVEFCAQDLRKLRTAVESVVAAREIVVDQSHLYLSDSVLNVLTPNDVVRLVHRLRLNDEITSPHELEWLRKVDELARKGRIRQVQRLFLYDEDAQCNEAGSLKLIAAHVHDRRYDCRLMPSETYDELIHQYGVPEDVVDFGIYGSHCVFAATEYGHGALRGTLKGVFKMQLEEVERFTRAFDALWQSSVTRRPDKPEGDVPKRMKSWLEEMRGRSPTSALLSQPGHTETIPPPG